ncbi:MAG TPA: hypothetical protein ENJ42_01515, partial [Hellea balneolensis]|nr:hypothetical protein [Hellea balneolensis]
MVRRMTDFETKFHTPLPGIPFIEATDLQTQLGRPGLLVIDVRDPRERERDGCIKGAYPMPRGMVEFWMHRDSPYYKSVFDKYDKYVFVCAKGWRAQLAAKSAQDMGFETSVLKDGMSGWKAASCPMVGDDDQPYYSLGQIESMLPYILRRENIAHYKDGAVFIGNRAEYPFKKEFVRCDTVERVAQAIENMITQGVGPWIAAVYAMVMRAEQCENDPGQDILGAIQKAKDRLIATRPTNTMIRFRLDDVLACATKAVEMGA